MLAIFDRKRASDTLAQLANRAHYYLVYFPLHEIYHRTYWRSANPADICATLSGTVPGANFWQDTEAARGECVRLIERHFDGWLAVAEITLYYACLYVGVRLAASLVNWLLFHRAKT